MAMVGDGEGQPTEGVLSLTDLAAGLEGDEAAPEESAEGDEAEDSEEVEAAEEDSSEESEEEAEEPVFTIKVDGKEITLTQSELIERAQKGTDYTNKTMAVAEERKAVETERAKVSEHRSQAEAHAAETLKRLEAYSRYMQAQLGQMPDAAMLDYDTAGYLRAKEAYESRRGQLQEARIAIEQIQAEQARQRQAWIAEKAQSTERTLKDTLPGWNDKTLDDLVGYAGELGLTPQTADAAFFEPGFWQLAHKAKAYDELLAKREQMKPVAKLPKVAKPGNSNQPVHLAKRQEAMKRYKASPSVSTLADLL